MDDPIKPDYFDALLMSIAFGIIMTTAFVTVNTANREAQKQLAESVAVQKQLAAELSKNWSSCHRMMKDPMTRRIMCADGRHHASKS
jgi:hypothetical protein